MDSNTTTNIYYYGAVTLITAPLIYAFILWLGWPLLAGVIFGGALYLHILNMSKYAKQYVGKMRKSGIDEASFLGWIKNKFSFDVPRESEQN